MIEKFIIWSFINYGLTNIMVYGKIFSPFRNFIESWSNTELWKTKYWLVNLPSNVIKNIGEFIHGIFSCVMCFSTWSGFFLSLYLHSPVNEFFGLDRNISWFFDGILSSGIVWTINAIVEWFEDKK